MTDTDNGYGKYLSKMDEDQLTAFWQCCTEAGLISDTTEISVGELTTALEGKMHVDVVVACTSVADPTILEILMSQPLSRSHPANIGHDPNTPVRQRGVKTPKAPKTVSSSDGVKIAAPSPDDPRIICEVKPNPKKPSSSAFGRYALYQNGISVAEFIRAGGTKADVAYDVGKGFIKLVPKEEWSGS